MDTNQAYDQWSLQYDADQNKTRDLEMVAKRSLLSAINFDSCLEVGCGTGKNTLWLSERCKRLVCIDISEGMLARAREKVAAKHVEFIWADIMQPLPLNEQFQLVTFSLVLEHIADLHSIFRQVDSVLVKGGHVYIGELHPFKQYTGTKARFTKDEETTVLQCFTHHFSDFLNAAKPFGLDLEIVEEFFDNDDRDTIPRIVSMLLVKR